MNIRELFRKHSAVIVLVAMLAFSFFGMWFSGSTVFANPRVIGMTVVSFFQNVGTSIGNFVGNTANSVQQLSDLRKQYDELAAKLQTYEEKQEDIDQLSAENQRLRAVLDFASSKGGNYIPAQIIGKDPGILFTTITINKGYNQGLQRGMPVIAVQDGKQGLVGKVQTVGPSTAQIQPIFDSQNFIAARLEKSRYEGLVNGGGSSLSDLTMTYLDPEAKGSVFVGDNIVSSGLNSIYPANLLIGTVSSIQAKPYETSLTLTIHPYIEFSRLEYIYLVSASQGGGTQ